MAQNMLRGTRCQDSSLREYVGAITDSQGLAHVVISDQYTDAQITQERDNALDAVSYTHLTLPTKRIV